jgi:hypothetical protein
MTSEASRSYSTLTSTLALIEPRRYERLDIKVKVLDSFNSTRSKLTTFIAQVLLYMIFNRDKFYSDIE